MIFVASGGQIHMSSYYLLLLENTGDHFWKIRKYILLLVLVSWSETVHKRKLLWIATVSVGSLKWKNHCNSFNECEPTSSKMKKLNKVRFLQSMGLLTRTLNLQTLRLERSLSLTVYSYLCLILKMAYFAKSSLSLLWPREESIQLYLGNITCDNFASKSKLRPSWFA